jgi:predicted nuclease with RNAse H fold
VKHSGILGIDYGSKTAGTTAIATSEGVLFQSEKKKDADHFVFELCEKLKPNLIALDAPLSLPGVYTELTGFSNYHYRQCDIELKAMSPLFLGGLTARAMALAAKLRAMGIEVIESYPKAQAQRLDLDMNRYKKDMSYLPIADDLLNEFLPHSTSLNFHQLDARLALLGGVRYFSKTAQSFGNATEGLIFV